MRIVTIREKTVPLSGNVSNAVVSFSDHTVSLVALVSDQIRNGKPVIGYGFNSIGRYAQGGILRERMIPRLLQASPDALLSEDGCFDPAAVARTAMQNEKPGGHGDRAGALGALELAVWDLNAKLADEPACDTIARFYGRQLQNRSTSVYAAGGYYYPGDTSDRLAQELNEYTELGFNAFKMKIGGASIADDLRRIESALQVAGEGDRLAVDANGRFDLETALTVGEALEDYQLRWYEEPGDPLDYALNSALAEHYSGRIATGENIFSKVDANNLVRFGGMRPALDIFQMDAGLSYGLTEYADMIASLEAAGFDRRQCFPHGGHLINLHIAVALGLGGCEAYPGVFQPFGGYPEQCSVADGQVWTTDAAGFGLEQKQELRVHLDELVDNL